MCSESAGCVPLVLQHRDAFYNTIRIHNLKADVKTHKSLSHNQSVRRRSLKCNIWIQKCTTQTRAEFRGMKAHADPLFRRSSGRARDERIHNSCLIFFSSLLLNTIPVKMEGVFYYYCNFLVTSWIAKTWEIQDEIRMWLISSECDECLWALCVMVYYDFCSLDIRWACLLR